MTYFRNTMENKTDLSRLVHLHTKVKVYELDLCKLSFMLQTLNAITQTVLLLLNYHPLPHLQTVVLT